MFKKSRKRIVAAIMSVLVLLWGLTLCIIYAFSYYEMSKQNLHMLQAHAAMYMLTRPDAAPAITPSNDESYNDAGIPSGADAMPPAPVENFPAGEADLFRDDTLMPAGGAVNAPRFQLSTFYTVALTYQLALLDVSNEQPSLYTDEELVSLAQELAGGSQSSGTRSNLAFYIADKGGYLLVSFVDNTVINESAATLLRYTLFIGAFALGAFFLLSLHLARKIVKPLEESYQKQKQFISDAGHELKTPVSVISANAELLERELGDNRWLANIQYENERMGLLVSQLLELARTEQLTPQLERIDFSRLCNGEALPFESVAFENGLTLCCDIPEGILLYGSSTQLKQLISILLDNAIRHSSGGKISLCLARERSFIRLSVINEGPPIPPEQQAHLFERFYRADPARTDAKGHYGLGLSIAEAITTAHKGSISVLCHDGLVEFRVSLPAS